MTNILLKNLLHQERSVSQGSSNKHITRLMNAHVVSHSALQTCESSLLKILASHSTVLPFICMKSRLKSLLSQPVLIHRRTSDHTSELFWKLQLLGLYNISVYSTVRVLMNFLEQHSSDMGTCYNSDDGFMKRIFVFCMIKLLFNIYLQSSNFP